MVMIAIKHVKHNLWILNGLLACVALLVTTTVPLFGADKSKDEETITKANKVLTEMLDSKSIPNDVLGKAHCILVLPGVKKFGIGIGGSGGRGPMMCRTGKDFTGTWSAPAMYSIGGGSAGLQVGGSSSDFVLLLNTQKAVQSVMSGKTKLGSDATAAAGPGATTAGTGNADIYTYGRAKGLFAGVSVGDATISADTDANKRLYGKATQEDILIKNSVAPPPQSEPMLQLLNSKTQKASGTQAKKAPKK